MLPPCEVSAQFVRVRGEFKPLSGGKTHEVLDLMFGESACVRRRTVDAVGKASPHRVGSTGKVSSEHCQQVPHEFQAQVIRRGISVQNPTRSVRHDLTEGRIGVAASRAHSASMSDTTPPTRVGIHHRDPSFITGVIALGALQLRQDGKVSEKGLISILNAAHGTPALLDGAISRSEAQTTSCCRASVRPLALRGVCPPSRRSESRRLRNQAGARSGPTRPACAGPIR
jgi:hypothetical protein